jgi:hypothetical protein
MIPSGTWQQMVSGTKEKKEPKINQRFSAWMTRE